MIKQAMAEANLAGLAVLGVVAFAAIFLAIFVWTVSRSRRQIATWSSLPLSDSTAPAEPRGAANALPVVSRPKESCGKCEVCTCE